MAGLGSARSPGHSEFFPFKAYNVARMRSFHDKAKTAVVFVSTACWLIKVVVRGQFLGESTNLDASWLMGLATLLQQGSIGGQDRHRCAIRRRPF